jgi:Amt family ammonium transporter
LPLTLGGVVGNLLTGIFAQQSVANLDGGLAPILGGWLDRHWIQLAYQLADSCAGMSYSFVVIIIIFWVMYFIPGLRLRVFEEAEIVGIDDAEMGEFAYDYVGIDADIGPKEQEMRAESPPSHPEKQDYA